VTYECPQRPGVLHVIESAYFAEVIDPATSKPAESGELVLTTLNRTGSPLLRYRTGDLVKCRARNAECDCGRNELPLTGGIIGRVDDMIIVRGVNVYPTAVEQILRGFADVAEYRARITRKNSLTELQIEIEPTTACDDVTTLAARISQAFETALALRVPVSVVAMGTLPRFEMKAKRWVCEVQ
jgi:phenylacetate-CoA ligase